MWYFLPAVLALLFKFYLLTTTKEKEWADSAWIAFIAVFCVHNVCEILGLFSFMSGKPALYLVRIYYICSLCVLCYAFRYVMTKPDNIVLKYVFYVLAGVSLIASILVAGSDLIIDGYTNITYSITATRGEYYWVFQTIILAGASAVIMSVLYLYATSDTQTQKVENLYNLLAFLPLALTSTAVVLLMMSDTPFINGVVIIPIASTLFLAVSVKGKSSLDVHKDPRDLIPFTSESDLAKLFNSIRSQYTLENLSHKEAMAMIEKGLVEYKHSKNRNNVTHTARSMGVSRSTLYNMFDRYTINRTEET